MKSKRCTGSEARQSPNLGFFTALESGIIERPESLHLEYAMGAALALTTILVVILASALYKMNKRISSQGWRLRRPPLCRHQNKEERKTGETKGGSR
ncbi:unnamed protein product [Merluccius merluccius]